MIADNRIGFEVFPDTNNMFYRLLFYNHISKNYMR